MNRFVSVGKFNPNFGPKILTKMWISHAHLQSSFRLHGNLRCVFSNPLRHPICASRISEPEMKDATKGNFVCFTEKDVSLVDMTAEGQGFLWVPRCPFRAWRLATFNIVCRVQCSTDHVPIFLNFLHVENA